MKKPRKIFILILIVIIFITGCSKGKSDLMNNENNDKIIENIDNSLYELSNNALSDYDKVIMDIETLTDSEFQEDIGSGRYILEFKHNEHISFRVFGIPIESWTILLDNEEVILE